MRVLICGAGGMLGRDLGEIATDAGHDVLALASAQLDVRDRDSAREWMSDFGPEVVINCAAWTDVDAAEEHEDEALAVNGDGAGNIAAEAAAIGASVVYVSTDYVFDGRKPEGYVEADATGPLSAYGRTKLAGERQTLDANPGSYVARTAWLFGAHGKNFVDSMLRRGRAGDPLRVVDDQVGCPTWTRHLAAGLLDLAASDDYGIHHLAGSGKTSWYEFTREIFSRAGVDTQLEPCTSDEFPRPAQRPAYSILLSTRGRNLPAWQEGLDGYLQVVAA